MYIPIIENISAHRTLTRRGRPRVQLQVQVSNDPLSREKTVLSIVAFDAATQQVQSNIGWCFSLREGVLTPEVTNALEQVAGPLQTARVSEWVREEHPVVDLRSALRELRNMPKALARYRVTVPDNVQLITERTHSYDMAHDPAHEGNPESSPTYAHSLHELMTILAREADTVHNGTMALNPFVGEVNEAELVIEISPSYQLTNLLSEASPAPENSLRVFMDTEHEISVFGPTTASGESALRLALMDALPEAVKDKLFFDFKYGDLVAVDFVKTTSGYVRTTNWDNEDGLLVARPHKE